MELRAALKGQYKAGLAMLRDCIAKCPDDLWAAGNAPIKTASERESQERRSRTFQRIAYHALFYTHLYAMPREEDFRPWPEHVEHAKEIYLGPDEEVPPIETTYTQAEVLEYLDWIDTQIDGWVDAVDLDSSNSGFDWYKDFPKLDHQILNIRHIGTHAGQLAERLNEAGIDTDWVSRR